jgi:RNA polymerase sigma factor for flagellar operon FliA
MGWRAFTRREQVEGLVDRRRQELIETNLPLVEHLVLRVSVGFPRFVDRQELIAAGMLGLTEAAEHFDFQRGVPFAAYAARRIRGAVLDVARSNDWTPRAVRQLARTSEDAAQSLTSQLGRHPSDHELAAEIGISVDELRTLRDQLERGVVAALDRRMDLDAPDLNEVLADYSALQPDELVESLELRGYLRAALAHLDERLRLIIVGYYLEGKTVEELGQLLDVTPSRISQLRAHAIGIIRHGIDSQYDGLPEGRPKGRVAIRQASYASAIARHGDWRTRLDGSRGAPSEAQPTPATARPA